MKRIVACCFTGHRPEKLKVPEKTVIKALKIAVEEAFFNGVTVYITGMSRGIDIWGAEAVLELKKEHPNIRLICAVPFDGFENGWEIEWQNKYHSILRLADEVYYICDGYSRRAFQLRNEWMIDHASMVIAGYTGAAGGTRNTIEYAKKKEDYTIRFLDLIG